MTASRQDRVTEQHQGYELFKFMNFPRGTSKPVTGATESPPIGDVTRETLRRDFVLVALMAGLGV